MIKKAKHALMISLIVCVLIFSAYIIQPIFLEMINKLPQLNTRDALVTLSLIYIIGNFLILPVGLPLNIIAGSLWGTFKGGLLINVLATFVAVVSFLLTRRYGIKITESLFGRYDFFQKFKAAIVRYDWQFIAMTRLNPIAPFSLSNYGFGLIPQLSFSVYLIATILANLLPCFIFSAIGATLKNAALGNPDIHHFILDIGIVLLLIFGLITLKMMMTQKFPQPPLLKDTSA